MTTRTSIASRRRTVSVVLVALTSASLAAVRNNLQGTRATIANLRGAVAAGC
jgi:hypothetical protein